MNKQTVAVVFGSRSAEHDVSIVTALASVIKPLELSGKYTVVPVYIAKDGRWFSSPKLKDIRLFTSGKIDTFLKSEKPILLEIGSGLTLVSQGLRPKKTKVDIVFPATHGTHGEDGELMAVLEMASVPYVGCGVTASVLAMDKVLSKLMAQVSDIPTPKFIHFTKHEYENDHTRFVKAINASLKYPLFVKPAHLGSSIGITRVTDKGELENAIEVALHYDDRALVEEAVPNLIEVTVPIMGNEELAPAMVEQPLLHTEDFFDFDTKYMQGGKKGKGGGKKGSQGAQGYSKLPAEIPKDLYEGSLKTAKSVYRALGCSGIARVDLLIDSKTKKIYFNEVNPLPGGLYAHNWRAAGISSVDLVEKLLALGMERFKEKAKLETTFSTNYLQQF